MQSETNTPNVKRIGVSMLLVAALGTSAVALGAERKVELYQTSRAGDVVKRIELAAAESGDGAVALKLDLGQRFQRIEGIGGAFTESSADALSALEPAERMRVIEAYFGPEGAHYSLTRTHVGSCDFSLGSYSYTEEAGDVGLEHFTIDPDRKLLLPLIKDAQAVVGAEFKILASPWTAPAWMKDNGKYFGGRLLPEYRETYVDYLCKYLDAYAAEGVPVWGLTPVNEPEGNDGNWESMHFNPEEMRDFVRDYLGPRFRSDGRDTKVFVFDQNRDHMEEWAKVIYGDKEAAQYIDGMAVHWYSSTVDVCADALDTVHEAYPEKSIMHTEGCIDALGDDEPMGAWLERDWYWRKEATDWGVFWASEEQKPDHPPYAPVYRYAGDVIGGLNHWMTGWIDWNLVLDERGGPNHVKNFCGAPVLVNRETKSVFYTPVFDAMCHFSRFIRPDAVRIGMEISETAVEATAVENADGSVVVVLLNREMDAVSYRVELQGEVYTGTIPGEALQTLVLR